MTASNSVIAREVPMDRDDRSDLPKLSPAASLLGDCFALQYLCRDFFEFELVALREELLIIRSQ